MGQSQDQQPKPEHKHLCRLKTYPIHQKPNMNPLTPPYAATKKHAARKNKHNQKHNKKHPAIPKEPHPATNQPKITYKFFFQN
jgi:hypothetical protein